VVDVRRLSAQNYSRIDVICALLKSALGSDVIGFFGARYMVGGTGRVRLVLGVVASALAVLSTGTEAVAQLSQPSEDQRRAESGGSKVVRESAGASGRAADNPLDDPKMTDESYQPEGIEAGLFLIFPLVDFSESFNSNIFATETDAKSDFVTRIAPELKARSRFTNHALNTTARVEQYYYSKYSSDNRTDASLLVDGRYDFSKIWEGSGSLYIDQYHEDRGSPDATAGLGPTNTHSATLQGSSKVKLGRYTVSGELTGAKRVYSDAETDSGTEINNGDRDRVETKALGRGSYEVFPGYAAIVEASVNNRNYDDSQDDAGFERSSHGYRIDTGVGVDISQLIRGDFLLGYFSQDYDDTRFTDPAGLSVKAQFNWTPSRSTVVVPSLERSVLETTTRNASGMVRTSAAAIVRHELRRNVVLTANAGVSYDDFQGTDQEYWSYEGRLRGVWSLSPMYYVGGEVGYRLRESNIAGQGYDQGTALVRFGIQR
jgi:hypothetical protein